MHFWGTPNLNHNIVHLFMYCIHFLYFICNNDKIFLYCYGLSVCVPPNPSIDILIPKMIRRPRGGEVKASQMGIAPLESRLQRDSHPLTSSLMWGTGPQQRPGILILLPSTLNCEKGISVVFISPNRLRQLWCSFYPMDCWSPSDSECWAVPSALVCTHWSRKDGLCKQLESKASCLISLEEKRWQ